MGGRGASSGGIKGGAGGSTGSSGSQSQTNSKLAEFQQMNAEQLVQLVNTMRSRPDSYYYDQGLNAGSPTQRLVTELGLNDKPIVLEDAEYDKMIASNPDMIQIYRGVYGNGSLTAQQVRQNTMYADLTYIGDGIHGDGLYFSTDKYTAQSYAGGRGAVTQAVINPSKVKSVTEDNIRRQFAMESNSVARNFRDISQYALYKGYNTIIAVGGNGSRSHANGGEDFYVPIDRSVLIIRKNTEP